MNILLQFKSPSKLVIPCLLIVPNVLLWAGILTVDGVVIQRDFNFPIVNDNFEGSYFPLWNDVTSQTNIERLPRLVMMSPFILLSVLGVEAVIISKIMIVTTFTFITITSYLFIKSLLTYATPAHPKKDKYLIIVAIISAFVFAYNPVNLQFIGGISLLASIGMLPLSMYLVLRAGTKRYFPLLIALPLVFSLGHPFVFVMNMMFTIIFMFVVYYRTLNLKHILSQLVLSSFVAILLLAWLIVPYLTVPTTSIELGRNQQLERDTFDLVSNNNFFKIFLLERDKFLYTVTEPSDFFGKIFHYTSLAIEVGIAFFALLFMATNHRLQKRTLLFLSAGFVACTFLALGSVGALDTPYWLFISQSGIGWIFRSPLKFQLYQGFFISVLLAMSLVIIKDKISLNTGRYRKAIISPLLLVMVLAGSSAYGIYNANLLSFNPISLPHEYSEINDILEAKHDGSRAIYYPRYNEIATSWSQGHLIGPFDTKSSRVPTYDLSTTYSYVKQMLFDYPFTNQLLSSPEYFEFLPSVGIKYIVFHNDRGYLLDQKNLEYLLSSNSLSTLYSKNGWYLFEVKGEPVQQIRAVHGVIETDNLATVTSISSPSMAVIDTSLLNGPAFPDNLVKIRLFDHELDVRLENLLQNPYFVSSSNGSLEAWKLLNQMFSVGRVLDNSNNEYGLELSTAQSAKNVWSNLVSNEIKVETESKYLFTLEARTNNALGTHAKIQGYDASEKTWKDLVFLTSELEGQSASTLSIKPSSDWTVYSKVVTIPNSNITKIRYVINAGTVVDQSLGNAVSLVRKVGVYNLNSIGDNGRDTTLDFVKINPTKYQVNIVNNGGPFVLSFAQAYEKGWIASYENKEIKSIPLFGMINGFYVDKAGTFTLAIEYRPQEFFWIGASISIIAIAGIALYLFILRHNEINKPARLLNSTVITATSKGAYGKRIENNASAAVFEKSPNSNATLARAGYFDKERTGTSSKPDVISDAKFDHTQKGNRSLSNLSTREAIINLIKTNPSIFIISCAIGLTLFIPLLVALSEDIANMIAGYALNSLVLGIIVRLIVSKKKWK